MTGPLNETLALAFGSGLVASVNPCGFALLPSLLFYYLGSDAPGETRASRVLDGLIVGLVLAAGFMVVFGSVGILVSVGARAIVRALPWVSVVMGLLLVVLGGWLLAGRHLSAPIPGLRAAGQRHGYRSLLGFGMAYAVGSLSCTLPIFLLVITSGLAARSVSGTLGIFFAYALGMSTVLMLLCLGTASFREILVRRIRRVFPHLNRISGGLLVVGGGYVAYYWISLLRGADTAPGIALLQDLQQLAQRAVGSVGNRVWLLVAVALAATALVTLAVRFVGRGDPGEVELLEDEVPYRTSAAETHADASHSPAQGYRA